MKKKLTALLLSLLLTVSLATPLAGAEDEVHFVAAGSSVLPLSDASMPFWSGGYLYISSAIFTGIAWEALGVGHIEANAKQPLILYGGGDKSLMFTPGAGYAKDMEGSTYYPGAIQRGGQTFVPAALVAKYFGLEYSLISGVEHGHLVWLRKPGFGLGDKDFANAAVYSMTQRYAEYEKSRTPGMQEGSALVNPNDPTDKRAVYLCIQAGDSTEGLLDVLSRQEVQAAFFCEPEFLKTEGDLLRQMVAMGHTVGLLADLENSTLTLEEQLRAGNDALYRATCTKTRLVMLKNGTQEDTDAAEAAGYCCFVPELDRSAYSLRSDDNAKTLLQRIAARREDATTVWLGETVSALGLRAFLRSAESGARCLALTELS